MTDARERPRREIGTGVANLTTTMNEPVNHDRCTDFQTDAALVAGTAVHVAGRGWRGTARPPATSSSPVGRVPDLIVKHGDHVTSDVDNVDLMRGW